jgi:hypothetical protein
MDAKLRRMASDLTAWSNKKVGNKRLQLALVRESILYLDEE